MTGLISKQAEALASIGRLVFVAVVAISLGWCVLELQRLTFVVVLDSDVFARQWGDGMTKVIRQNPSLDPEGEPESVWGDFKEETILPRYSEVFDSAVFWRPWAVTAIASCLLACSCFLVFSGCLRLRSLLKNGVPRSSRVGVVSSITLGFATFCGIPHLFFSGWMIWWPGFNGNTVLADPQWDVSSFVLDRLHDSAYAAAWCLFLALLGGYCLFAQVAAVRQLSVIHEQHETEYVRFKRALGLYVAILVLGYLTVSVALGEPVGPGMLLPPT